MSPHIQLRVESKQNGCYTGGGLACFSFSRASEGFIDGNSLGPNTPAPVPTGGLETGGSSV